MFLVVTLYLLLWLTYMEGFTVDCLDAYPLWSIRYMYCVTNYTYTELEWCLCVLYSGYMAKDRGDYLKTPLHNRVLTCIYINLLFSCRKW